MENTNQYEAYVKELSNLFLSLNLFPEDLEEDKKKFFEANKAFDIVQVQENGKYFILFLNTLSILLDQELALVLSELSEIKPVKEFYLFSYDRKLTTIGDLSHIFYESNFLLQPSFVYVANDLEKISILQGRLPPVEDQMQLKFRVQNSALLYSVLFKKSNTETVFFKKVSEELEPFELFQLTFQASEDEKQPLLIVRTRKYDTAESFSRDHSFILNLKRYLKMSYDCNIALVESF